MSLSPAELRTFKARGYLGPFTAFTPREMITVRRRVEVEIEAKTAPYAMDSFESRHQDCRSVYDICTERGLLSRMQSLLGENILLWNSVLVNKTPGSREIPWHQDRDFLLLDPPINSAAWFAVDDATTKNGCLQVIPGSHKRSLPHIPRVKGNEFVARVDISHVNKGRALDLEMKAGQYVLFHDMILHHSAANFSLNRRMGLVIRFTVPGVKVNRAGLFRKHRVYVVSGRDANPLNPHGAVPPGEPH